MGLASSKVYIPKDHDNNPDLNQKVDTNVICIGFSILKKDHEKLLATGDPVFCKNCKASISFLSKLEPKNVEKPLEGTLEKIWRCEFCFFENVVFLEEEEIPKNSDVIYMVENANQKKKDLQDDCDVTVVYCIDNSGSMSVTKEIDGKHSLKHGESMSEAELEELKQFMEPWEFAQIVQNLKSRTKTHVSRKSCVVAAVENQLLDMISKHPKRKSGLVVFNDDVTVVGDGTEVPHVFAGDKLSDYNLLLEQGKKIHESHLSKHCAESFKQLASSLEKLKETGKTALGPALLVSVALASRGKPGSTVILCTDGLANVGLGSFEKEEGEKSRDFYEKLETFAKDSGVTISVVTIIGEQCKLDVLGQIVVNTNGSLTRMSPEDLVKNFGNALKDEVIATNVDMKLFLNKAIRFRNEDEKNLFDGGSLCLKKVGNVTDKSEVTFEYMLKTKEELEKLKIDQASLKEIPFQSQIFFDTKEGHRFVRVMTRRQEVSQDKTEVEKDAKIGLLAARAKERAADLAIKGKVEEAQKVSNEWGSYMNKNAEMKPKNHPSHKNISDFNVLRSKNAMTFNSIAEIKNKEMEKPPMKVAHGQPKGKSAEKVKEDDLDEHYEAVFGLKTGKFVGRTEEDID